MLFLPVSLPSAPSLLKLPIVSSLNPEGGKGVTQQSLMRSVSALMSIPLPFHTPNLTEKVTLLFTFRKMGGTLFAYLLKSTAFLLNEFNARERRDKKAGGRSLFLLSI